MAAAFIGIDSRAVRVTLVVLASASDLLDGFAARKSQNITRWGALLDPIADKTFVLVALTAFILDGLLSTRDYFVILSRDLATAVGFLVAYKLSGLDPKDFKARMSGKIVTVLQLAAILVVLLSPAYVPWVVVAIGVASVYAIVDYTAMLARTRARARASA